MILHSSEKKLGEELLTAFVDALDYGVIVTGKSGNIMLCSHTALQLMGLENDHQINSSNWVDTLDILDPVSLSRIPLDTLLFSKL
ncbi:MAG: PAS domain-containing protein [Saprospiraceae bacterium]